MADRSEIMVEYDYENLFADHFAANILVVDSGATVTIVPGAHPIVSGELFKIENEQLKAESFKLSESICSNSDLTFGKMEASKVTFSFKNSDSLPTDLSDKEIDIYLYFNWDSSSLFKVGRYIVENDKYSENNYVRNITAYDILYRLKDEDITQWYYDYFSDGEYHTLEHCMEDLFDWLKDDEDGPGINIDLESGYSLCNGGFPIKQSIESDYITFEFFMQRLLEWNGAFGHINREGNFQVVVLEWYSEAPVRTIINEDRIPPTDHDIVSTWGIGGIDVYNKDNICMFSYRNTSKKVPSVYVIADSFITDGYEEGSLFISLALRALQKVIYHTNYKPCNVKTTGDLCVEVGDRINVSLLPDEGVEKGWFRTYVLERSFSGIQGMTDTYRAKGNKKQPVYITDSKTAHAGENESDITTSGSNGVSRLDNENDRRFIALMRNYGEPMLDEPVVDLVYNKEDGQVEIKWTDPADITSYSPLPIEWAGTEVVRKEGSAPLHDWSSVDSEYGGTVLVTSTTRDEYSETAYVDDTIEPNKRYYYAIRPYFIKLDDAEHPIKQYRWTKIISVDTQRILVAPTITTVQVDGTSVTALYLIPALEVGSYTSIKLAAKKNNIPASISDADEVMDIPEPTTLIPIGSATMTGLDELSQYYFVIFVEDDAGNTASSEAVEAVTEENPAPPPEYEFILQTNDLYQSSYNWLQNDETHVVGDGGYWCEFPNGRRAYTLISDDFTTPNAHSSGTLSRYTFYCANSVMTIRLTTQSGGTVSAEYSESTMMADPKNYVTNQFYQYDTLQFPVIMFWWSGSIGLDITDGEPFTPSVSYKQLSFDDMLTALQYVYKHYANINLYADGEKWLSVN